MARKSSSRRRSSAAKKPLIRVKSEPLEAGSSSKRRKSRKSGSRKSKKSSSRKSSSKGISEDALAVLLLTRTEQEGKDVDNILPFLLLSGNSLKHSMLPIVILHLQNSKTTKSNLLPYLLAFSQGSMGEDNLLPLLLMMRDGNGNGLGGNGMGFGNQGMNALLATGQLGGGSTMRTLGMMNLFNQNQQPYDPASFFEWFKKDQETNKSIADQKRRNALRDQITTRELEAFRSLNVPVSNFRSVGW